MYKIIVNAWENHKDELRQHYLTNKHPTDYREVIKRLVFFLSQDKEFPLDITRITGISEHEFNGTMLFVIGEQSYQPEVYWSVYINYGSCETSDTLKSIREYSEDLPTADQVAQYMQLSLNIVQKLKPILDSESYQEYEEYEECEY